MARFSAPRGFGAAEVHNVANKSVEAVRVRNLEDVGPSPCAGKKSTWGRRGSANVHLKPAKKASVRSAIAAAWLKAAPEGLAEQLDANRPRQSYPSHLAQLWVELFLPVEAQGNGYANMQRRQRLELRPLLPTRMNTGLPDKERHDRIVIRWVRMELRF